MPATVRIPLWNQTDSERYHVPFINQPVDGGESNGDITFNQTTLVTTETTEIPITVNGGVLPVTDSKIQVVASGFGIIPPASLDPDFGWTADRVSSPNKIILEAGAPVDPFYINIQIAIPAVS